MARKKEYVEDEVIEKAMELFWRNGYESTSVRMLEKEMGINQFSIYSSFGSKEGVFIQSLKRYTQKVDELIDKLAASAEGITGIKQYFYDFIQFTQKSNINRGCLIVNTVAEMGNQAGAAIMAEIQKIVERRDKVFIQKLNQGSNKDAETVNKQVNFLSIALAGLAVSSKVLNKQQLDDFIDSTFEYL